MLTLKIPSKESITFVTEALLNFLFAFAFEKLTMATKSQHTSEILKIQFSYTYMHQEAKITPTCVAINVAS